MKNKKYKLEYQLKIQMRLYLITAFVFLGSNLFGQKIQNIELKKQKLQKVLDNTIDDKLIFGCSFKIKKDTLIWEGSAGNFNNKDSYFIASTTKLFTTSLILQLQSIGKLSIDDKIINYLPQELLNNLHIYKGIDYTNEMSR